MITPRCEGRNFFSLIRLQKSTKKNTEVDMPSQKIPDRLLTCKELAAVLAASPKTIAANVSRAPHLLPRYLKRGRNVYWRWSTVQEWLEDLEAKADQERAERIEKALKRPTRSRGPGRPTKSEQVAARRAGAGAGK